jgi:hypothetical protein
MATSPLTFTIKNINVSKLDKTHIIPDMAETSFKTSPRNKKTKIKDILEEKKQENTLDDDASDKIVINVGVQKVVFYTTIGTERIVQNQTLSKTYCCYHCHVDINSEDFFLGIPVKLKDDCFECCGIVCGFECAVSHIRLRNIAKDPLYSKSYYLISNMYFKLYKKLMPRDIGNRPMFAFEMLEKYGGSLKKYGNKVVLSTNILKTRQKDDKGVVFSIQPTIYEELKK